MGPTIVGAAAKKMAATARSPPTYATSTTGHHKIFIAIFHKQELEQQRFPELVWPTEDGFRYVLAGSVATAFMMEVESCAFIYGAINQLFLIFSFCQFRRLFIRRAKCAAAAAVGLVLPYFVPLSAVFFKRHS